MNSLLAEELGFLGVNVDQVVDSGWLFTELATKIREGDSTAVFRLCNMARHSEDKSVVSYANTIMKQYKEQIDNYGIGNIHAVKENTESSGQSEFPTNVVATVGDNEYTDLKSALLSLSNGDTLVLKKNADIGGNISLGVSGTVSILLNGNQITDSSSIEINPNLNVISDFISNRYVAPSGYIVNWKSESSDMAMVTYNVVASDWPVTIVGSSGSVSYEDWVTMVKNVKNGDTVVLNKDISDGITLKSPSGDTSDYTVMIDMNGHSGTKGCSSVGHVTTKITGNGVISNGTSSSSKAVSAYGGSGFIVIENGIYSAGVAVSSEPGYNDTTAEAIINGGTFNGSVFAVKISKASGSSRTNYGKVTINGGDFNGGFSVPDGAESCLVIKGGSFDHDPTAFVDGELYEVSSVNGRFVVMAK